MATAEYNHEDFQQTRQSEQDEKLLVKFYTKTVKDNTRSTEQSRAVFKDVEYVSIKVPGTRGAGASRPATFRDKQRFPKHYSAFQQRIEMPLEGTPLSEWPVVTRSHAEELGFLGVKTVEQLAGMSDSNASQFMGGQSFKAKANAWLAQAQKDVSLAKFETELALRDAQIEALSAKLDALLSESKPKRKRRTPEEMKRDNELSDIGQRPAEPGGSGSGADTGS